MLIRYSTSMLLRNSYSTLMDRMRKLSSSHTAPKILSTYIICNNDLIRLTDFGLCNTFFQEPLLFARLCQLATSIGDGVRLSSSAHSANFFTKFPSCWSILLLSKDIAEPAHPLDVNTLHNVHVVKELLQLTNGSNAEIIAILHYTEDLIYLLN